MWPYDLLPFFMDYYAGVYANGRGTWPDGRGLLYQPVKLVQAFAIWLPVQHEVHQQEMKAKGDKDA